MAADTAWAGLGNASLSVSLQHPESYTYYSTNVSVLDTFGYELAYEYPDSQLVVEGLYPGIYTIKAETMNKVLYLGGTDDPKQAQWIRLADGEHAGGYTIALPGTKSVQNEITISGKLVSSEGTLSYSAFSLIAISAEDTIRKDRRWDNTDNLGAFSATLFIPDGDYFIAVLPDGYTPQWLNGEPYTAAPQTVTIAEESIYVGEIQVSEGAGVHGSILDNGEPIEEGFNIECIDQDGYIVASTYVYQGDSTYSIDGLIASGYYLKISAWSDIYKSSYYPASEKPGEAEMIVLEEGEQKTIDLTTIPADETENSETATIEGELWYQGNHVPIEASIDFTYDSPVAYDTWGWADDGLFSEDVVADNPFKLYCETNQGYFVGKVWYPGVWDEEAASKISVSADETRSIVVNLLTGGSAGGFVSFNGTSVYESQPEGCEYYSLVVAFRSMEDRAVYGEITDMSGYRLTGLAPGTYNGYAMTMTYGDCGTHPGFTRLPEFTVEEGNTTVLPEIALTSGSGSIKGTGASADNVIICVDEDGQLVSFAEPIQETEEFRLKAGLFYRDWQMRQTTGTREFTISSLPPGNYYLASLSYDYNMMEGPSLHWYGSESPVSTFIESFQYSPPSDAALITVGDGQEVTIDMLSADTRHQASSSDLQSIVRVYPTPGKMNVSISIRDRVSPDAELLVHTCRGRLVHRSKITEKHTTAVWPANGSRISSGTYLFSVHNNGRKTTTRANLIR